MKLTKKQLGLIEFIKSYSAENGVSPSYREIMEGLGLKSVSAVAEHVSNLTAAGVLRKVDGTARSLGVVEEDLGEVEKMLRKKMKELEREGRLEEMGVLERVLKILKDEL